MAYVEGRFMEIAVIEGYDNLLTGDQKIPADDTDIIKDKGVSELKLTIKTAYNDLILAQEYMVCFQIGEEAKTKANKYGN